MLGKQEWAVAGAYRYNLRSPIRWIASHIGRYRWLPVVVVAGNLVGTALYSYAPVLLGRAFEIVSAPDRSTRALLSVALLILVTRLGAALLDIIKSWVVEILAQRIERDARDELMRSLLGKSQTFHQRQQVGDIMARATNDVRQLNPMLNPGMSLILESTTLVIVPVVMIAMLNVQLLLAPLVFLAAFAVALRGYTRQLNPVAAAARERFGTLNAHLAEAVSGIEVVKAYAQEAHERRHFISNARAFRDMFVKEGEIRARYLPFLLYGIMTGAGFAHAILLYRQGVIDVGTIVAYMGLLGILRIPTFLSLWSFALVQTGIAGAKRILELITAQTELDANTGGVNKPIAGAVRFDDVTFGYGGTPLLKHITFEARPGETVAIVGQTGAGKSTLTKLVNRIYDATGGCVLIDGVDVREWSLESLRSQISTIEQDVFLFSRSIADNIAFGARGAVAREQIEQAAREAQAHEFITQLPDGYDTVIGERGVTLSGGQRQRIAIARAFLTDPRILILDDSTSAIDSATEDQIQRAMRRVLQGRTTLLITHRLSQIRWADRILVLRRGELVDQGAHDELLARSDAYRRIFARTEDEAVSMTNDQRSKGKNTVDIVG
jgi:ATP-binding cassette subfamily B protein